MKKNHIIFFLLFLGISQSYTMDNAKSHVMFEMANFKVPRYLSTHDYFDSGEIPKEKAEKPKPQPPLKPIQKDDSLEVIKEKIATLILKDAMAYYTLLHIYGKAQHIHLYSKREKLAELNFLDKSEEPINTLKPIILS